MKTLGASKKAALELIDFKAINAALKPFIGNNDAEFSVSLDNPASFSYHTEDLFSVNAVRAMIRRLPILAKDGISIIGSFAARMPLAPCQRPVD